MGMYMYTELNCGMRLKKDTPQEVIEMLRHIVGDCEDEPPLPEHPLFKTDRWYSVMRSCSAYFVGSAHSFVYQEDYSEEWTVIVRSNLKNYCSEIEHFIDWITPHVDAMDGDFIGYMRYKETEVPTLIFHPNRLFKPDVPESVAWN